jgi:peptidoglycan/LPS O-acetylase OafA/YrhL
LFGFGHEAVILFFIVSGFSIHYSASKMNCLDKNEIKGYFYRRIRRIYPVFFISLIFSLFALYLIGESNSFLRVLYSFLFLTDISAGSISDPIQTNFPIWSLSYEMFYYLLYPILLLSIKKLGMNRAILYSVLLSVVFSTFGFIGIPNHLCNLLQYYWTWTIGVFLADYILKNKPISLKWHSVIFVSCFAFMFTIEKISVLRDWFWCLFFVSIFMLFLNSKKDVISRKFIGLNFGLSICAVAICYYLSYFDIFSFHPDLVRLILFALVPVSVVFIFIQRNVLRSIIVWFLRPFVITGGFSYALYIVHWPILVLVKFYFVENKDLGLFAFCALIVLSLLVMVLVSNFLERTYHPIVSKFIDSKFYKD